MEHACTLHVGVCADAAEAQLIWHDMHWQSFLVWRAWRSAASSQALERKRDARCSLSESLRFWRRRARGWSQKYRARTLAARHLCRRALRHWMSQADDLVQLAEQMLLRLHTYV